MKLFIVIALVAAASAAPQWQSMEQKKMVAPGSWERHEVSTTHVLKSQDMPATWERHEVSRMLKAEDKPASLERHEVAEARMLKPVALASQARSMAMSKDGGAEIVEHAFDMDEPGRYVYHYKTNNGIAMMEQASLDKDAANVKGAYEWTSPEGETFKLEYVADELGYHPMAAHLPVAPEIPVAIQRSLEWNAAHPEEEKEQAEMYLAKKQIMH